MRNSLSPLQKLGTKSKKSKNEAQKSKLSAYKRVHVVGDLE